MREQVKGAGHAIGNSMMGDDAAAPLLAAALRAPVPGWQVFDGGAAPKWMRLGTGQQRRGIIPASASQELLRSPSRRICAQRNLGARELRPVGGQRARR